MRKRYEKGTVFGASRVGDEEIELIGGVGSLKSSLHWKVLCQELRKLDLIHG